MSKQEKDAQRKRDARKKQREALAAIKVRLKMPVEELKRLAEEKKEADRQQAVEKLLAKLKRTPTDAEIENALMRLTNMGVIPGMNDGAFLTGASHARGLIITAGRSMEGIFNAKQRGAAFDAGLGHDEWADGDKRRVRPEGAGTGEMSKDDSEPFEPAGYDDAPDASGGDGYDGPKSNPGGWVKLGDADLGQALINLRHTLFAEGICRACLAEVHDGILAKEKHLANAHEVLVAHEIRRIKRGRRK